MKIAHLFRFALTAAAVCIVAWSFGEVTSRTVHSYFSERKQPIRLTVLHWGDQAEDKIVDSLVADYEKQHPLVQITRINGGGEFDSKLRTMMAAGTPPDLFYLQPDSLADFASMKLISPIDDRFAKESANFRYDFFPLIIDGFKYDTTTQRVGSGHLYGSA